MNRTSFLITFVGVSCFALGFGSAVLMRNTPELDADTASADPQIQPMVKITNSSKVPSTRGFDAPAGTENRRPEVPEHLFAKLLSGRTTQDVLPNNTVSDELADCLAMNNQERASINEALQTSLQALKAEQRLHTKVTHSDNDSTKLVIEKFSATGNTVKAQLMQGLRTKNMGNQIDEFEAEVWI